MANAASDSTRTAEPVPPGTSPVVAGVVTGALAGFLSGLFGVGGGILIVPGLVLVAGVEQRRAHGTSLTAIIPIALAGVAGYVLDGLVDWPVAALVALGAASGGLAGLLGVGGGIVMVPAFVLLFALSPAAAKATSLAVIIPTSLVGTWRNLRRRNTDVTLAAIVGFAGVVTAFVASRISVDLDPALSNALFAALLVVVAVRLVYLEVGGSWRARGLLRWRGAAEPPALEEG